MDVVTIAEIVHNVNRAYCQALGDESQLEWRDAPEWQRESMIEGVQFRLDNPNATIKDTHDTWLAKKLADGWVYGEVKDVDKKTHPNCVDQHQLPLEQQAKDYISKSIIEQIKNF